MLETELQLLISKVQKRECEERTVEVKSAHLGCPEKLYDTFSSFSNQDEGGVILFGLDECAGFQKVGVYDAQELQKRLVEVGEEMTPVVRPVLSVCDENGMIFVSAEIPPVDIAERPCFKTARGRLRGSYIRVGDADKPMTEYEVYSYEAFRKKYRDDIRAVAGVTFGAMDHKRVDEYIRRRTMNRPNLSELTDEQIYELIGITVEGRLTLAAVLLFGLYPQAHFPQLSIIASNIPGTEIGILGPDGQRFIDSKRIEGTIPEMLDAAVAFVRSNMRVSVRIDPISGKRTDAPEYPMDAVREAILNALVHRDYSVHTENMPIQLTLFSDRLEISNPGGLYGRLTIDQLGKAQPDTRNPFLVTAMEALGKTENRYSGIPRIYRAMSESGRKPPAFSDSRGTFSVCLYGGVGESIVQAEQDFLTSEETIQADDPKGLLAFCKTPRSRSEIITFLNIPSVSYALKRYLEPLVKGGLIGLSIPEHPKSPRQIYQTIGGNEDKKT